MTIESHADGEALGRVASLVLEEMLDALEPGMTTAELDAIGRAVRRTARAHRPRVIENLGSHGVGRVLREAPDHIPGYDEPRGRRVLREGMVIASSPSSPPAAARSSRPPTAGRCPPRRATSRRSTSTR